MEKQPRGTLPVTNGELALTLASGRKAERGTTAVRSSLNPNCSALRTSAGNLLDTVTKDELTLPAKQ